MYDVSMTDETRTLERLSVNMIPRTSQALKLVTEVTKDTKTDTINRAIQVYAYMMGIVHAGGEVYVRKDGGELEKLTFL